MTATTSPRKGDLFTYKGRQQRVVAVRPGVVWYSRAVGTVHAEQMPATEYAALVSA